MVQFSYPDPKTAWSVGKMRKRGDKQLAMDLQRRGQPEPGLAEMEKAAGMGLAARGGAIANVPMVQGASPAAGQAQDIISQQKAQIQDAVSQVASGDMTSGAFKKLLKKFGWSGDHETGTFTDPAGQQHTIEAEAE